MIRKPEDGSRGENGPGTTTAARRSGPSPGEHVSSSRATADFTAVPPSTPERCRLLLRQWRSQLSLTLREASVMAPELAGLDRQLRRLEQHRLRLAVHGRVGVGKSSLLNALLGEERFATDVAHGCTRRQQVQAWALPLSGIAQVELVDTPGIDEIADAGRARLASRVAIAADLVLLVLDGDLSRVEQEAVEAIQADGTPLLLVLNRCDCWPASEIEALCDSIQQRLGGDTSLRPLAVAAAPRQATLLADGRVRSQEGKPRIEPLLQELQPLLERHGDLLLALAAVRAADRFNQALLRQRLRHGRRQAQALIGRYAAIKAGGVAANPLPLLDLAGGMACDSALVLQLSRLYGLPMTRSGARALLLRLSGHNALLGGIQLGLQLLLSGVRSLLLLAAPVSGGLTLAPAAPVALAQAALAVATTRRTGRLAAQALLRSTRAAGQPGALLRRLTEQDPHSRAWLDDLAQRGHRRTEAPWQPSRQAADVLLP